MSKETKLKESSATPQKQHISYKITIPKFDNAGHRIRIAAIRKYADRVIEHFGGVTIDPKVLGGWKGDDGKIQYDENAVLYGIRLQSSEAQAAIDQAFMQHLAKQIATEFGQESVLTMEDDPDKVILIEGQKKHAVPEELREKDFFGQLTD